MITKTVPVRGGSFKVDVLSGGLVDRIRWVPRALIPVEPDVLIEFGVSFRKGEDEEVVHVFAPCKQGIGRGIRESQNCINLLMRGWRVRQIWEVAEDEF